MKGLRAAPITVPCLALLPAFLWWAADGAGYSITRWAPVGVGALLLLGVAAAVVPNGWDRVPRATRVSVLALGAFTVWSFLSVTWADDRGAAWEGADRTLLYFVLFALFTLWRQSSSTALGIVSAWGGCVVGLAAVTVARLALDAHPTGLFQIDRLATPAGYPNATAATFAMALWPAVVLAGNARVPVVGRMLAAGGAVWLAGLTVLTLSRGALIAVPLTGLIAVAVVPNRLRTLGAAAVVAAGVGAGLPALLKVDDALSRVGGTGGPDAIASAGRALLIGGALVAVVMGVVAGAELRRPPSAAARAWVTQAVGALLIAVAVAGVVGALAFGNPGHRLDSAWHSFKGDYGDNDPNASSRLTAGLGSGRYDFYRVALDEFREHPLRGTGVDTFGQAYLVHGTTAETPRYPHSVELRTLAQTGLIGTALLLLALGGAFVSAARGMRGPPGSLRPAVGGAALLAFVYVLVHGSADWFWETAGLQGPAFALLGLAGALAPRRATRTVRTTLGGPAAWGSLGVIVVAGAGLLGVPWLSERELSRAADVVGTRPAVALARLDRAARLDRLSDRPALLKGTILERLGALVQADAAFAAALKRVPDGEYATLQRGALASALGDDAGAARFLARAVALSPRDPLAREAKGVVAAGGAIDLEVLERRLLDAADQLGQAPSSG